MNASWEIPADLARFAGGCSTIEITAATFPEALRDLFLVAPDLQSRIVDPEGDLHAHLVILRNGNPLSHDAIYRTAINEGDELEIFFVASGG